MDHASAHRKSGIIRCKIRDSKIYVGRSAFERELKRRSFPDVENGGQLIIFCNQEPIRVYL
jgi:hypothetical protein